MKLATLTGIGNAWERVIELSARASAGRVALYHLPQSGAKFTGAGKAHSKPMPCDFIGTLRGGRGLFFDAKSTLAPNRFNYSAQHVHDHQRAFLVRMGEAGAAAGLLVEARDSDIQAVCWINWTLLKTDEPSVEWADPRVHWLPWITQGTFGWELPERMR